MIVDTFKTQTFDNVPVELEAAVGSSEAKLVVPGIIRYRVIATLPKDKAFRLYNRAFVLTHKELLKEADFK
jgi:hypothetical protein